MEPRGGWDSVDCDGRARVATGVEDQGWGALDVDEG